MRSYLVYLTLNIIFSVVDTNKPYPIILCLHVDKNFLFTLESDVQTAYMKIHP